MPIFGSQWNLPTSRIIDRKLITGSSLFGIGWGLSGICPGPGLIMLGDGDQSVFVWLWILALVIGMRVHPLLTPLI